MAEVCCLDLGLVSSKGELRADTHSDYYEKSVEERHLVFKLDTCMLAVMTLGWWVKNLDQSNVSLSDSLTTPN
jgi:hypothetical protein